MRVVPIDVDVFQVNHDGAIAFTGTIPDHIEQSPVLTWDWYGGARIHAEKDPLIGIQILYNDYLEKFCTGGSFKPIQEVTWSVGLDHVFAVECLNELARQNYISIQNGFVGLGIRNPLSEADKARIFPKIAAAVTNRVGLPYHLQWRILHRVQWSKYAASEQIRLSEWRNLPAKTKQIANSLAKNRLVARIALAISITSLLLAIIRLIFGK